MSGFETLTNRIDYYGGKIDNRLDRDKLWSLKQALLNSYQSEIIVLNNGKKFKCLINPDKMTMDYDSKIISIPYKEKCLNMSDKNEVMVGLKTGDTFHWEKTNTHWLVFTQYLEERAYFRADIKKCDQKIQIADKEYWIVVRGPVETSIQWNQKGGVEWNNLNYSQVIYITKDSNTMDYFTRFKKVKMKKEGSEQENTWEVAGVNSYYGENLIQVFLNETFNNTIEEEAKKEQVPEKEPIINTQHPYIEGPRTASVYDTITLTAKNFLSPQGKWYIYENDQFRLFQENTNTITIDLLKPGEVLFSYETEMETLEHSIKVNKF